MLQWGALVWMPVLLPLQLTSRPCVVLAPVETSCLPPTMCPCRYDERTELADQVNVRNVPMFQYYMNGKLVEQFATRDKARISLSIDKYVPGAVSL